MRRPNEIWQKMQELSAEYKNIQSTIIFTDNSIIDKLTKLSEIVAQEEILMWVLNNEADGNN